MNKYTELLTSLWFAYQNCIRMPREKQKESIQLYLTLLLSDWSSEQIIQLVSYIKKRSGKEEIPVFKANAGKDTGTRKENVVRKKKTPENNSDSTLFTANILNRFEELSEINDRAMDKAVKKSFARLLNAISPEKIKSGMSIEE